MSTYHNRALLFIKQGKFDEALDDFSKAIDINPAEPRSLNGFAWALVTAPDVALWDVDRAVELASKATSLDPGKAAYWNTLGMAQYRAEAFHDAIESLSKSLELDESGRVFDAIILAMAHWQLDEHEDARQWYGKAVDWAVDWAAPSISDADDFQQLKNEAEALGIHESAAEVPTPDESILDENN